MKRPKNFLFAIVLLSVLAVVLGAAIRAARERHPAGQTLPAAAVVIPSVSPIPVSDGVAASGTPSAAAQRRAKEFNDAASRFNAPDDQQH